MEKRLIILVHTELKSLGKSATKRFKFGRINSFNNIFIYIHVMVFVRGSARIRHTRSGEVYTVFAEQIEFDELDAEERGMSAEVTYQAVVDHPDLGELAWTLSEYPVGAENYRETDVGEHEVLQNIEFGLGAPSLAAQRDQTIQSLVDWFFERYEDPVHAMPYNGKEGGYLYVGGGPFDANEQLFDAFPEMPKGIIEAAVNEIEAEGTLEWAARRDRQDFDDEETLFENRPDTDGDDHVGHAHDENEASQLNDLIQALPDQVDPGYNVSNRGKASVAAPTDLGDSPVDDPLFVDLKSTAEEFLSNLQGSNGHVDLFDEVVAYVESLRGDTYSVQRHYARGVRFSNIVAETQALIKGDALPPLRAGQAAKMRSILDLHAAYIMSSPEGRKLSEGASAYQQTPQALATTKVAAQKISQAVEQAVRKSTRLNSSHLVISYAVFCLKKKKDNKSEHLQRDFSIN